MARFIAIAALLVSGCSLYDGGKGSPSDPAPPESPLLVQWKSTVLPMLQASCGGCHAGGTLGMFDFLSGATPEDQMTRFLDAGVLPTTTTEPSILLTKGPHEGPAFTADEQAQLSQWIMLAESEGY